ncbi:MAG: sugar phosphate isomerase/epimerase [bacterium]|nr:sugar phosphate isomerase/epimerase [bacterium]
MKISYNPYQIRFTPLDRLGNKAARFGYRYMDLSPREDFVPLYCHPRASRQRIARLRRSLDASGVELTALYGLFKWSSADEHERAGGSRYMRRTIEISAELECPVVSTEFGTSRNTRYVSENQFWRSMDETLPILERTGVELRIEPHPDDFVEDHYHGVDMVRAIDSPYVTYLYCVPHTHYLGSDIAAMIRYAGDTLTHIHAADTYHPSRYIANPSDTDVRLHQHLDIGQGDVDFDSLFSSLAEIGFDGVISSCVTAWTERAEESARLMLLRISGYATRYGLGIEGGDTG